MTDNKNEVNRAALQTRLFYQSCHRGCKEMDIILSNFAQTNLAKLTDLELDEYDQLLALDDYAIYSQLFSSSPSRLLNKIATSLALIPSSFERV